MAALIEQQEQVKQQQDDQDEEVEEVIDFDPSMSEESSVVIHQNQDTEMTYSPFIQKIEQDHDPLEVKEKESDDETKNAAAAESMSSSAATSPDIKLRSTNNDQHVKVSTSSGYNGIAQESKNMTENKASFCLCFCPVRKRKEKTLSMDESMTAKFFFEKVAKKQPWDVDSLDAPFETFDDKDTVRDLKDILGTQNITYCNLKNRDVKMFREFQTSCRKLQQNDTLVRFWRIYNESIGLSSFVLVVKARDNIGRNDDGIFWCVMYDGTTPDYRNWNEAEQRKRFYAFECPAQLCKEAWAGGDERPDVKLDRHWIALVPRGKTLRNRNFYNMWNMIHYDCKPRGKNEVAKKSSAVPQSNDKVVPASARHAGKTVYMAKMKPIVIRDDQEEEEDDNGEKVKKEKNHDQTSQKVEKTAIKRKHQEKEKDQRPSKRAFDEKEVLQRLEELERENKSLREMVKKHGRQLATLLETHYKNLKK